MGKIPTPATVASNTVAKAETGKSIPLNLDEFCSRLSSRDRRVELIGGFFAAEKLAGHNKDTVENFTVRFAAFINKPA